jgi:peptide/nickel transport system substrate-binding protein
VFEAVKTGQVDWAPDIPPQQYDQAKREPSITLYEWSAVNSGFRYMEYNTKRTPMDDKLFRQALNYAVDRDNLVKLAEAGLGKAQYSFITPDSMFYNKNVKEYKYNVETARKMLADAGYKLDGGKLLDKTGKPIELTVLFPTSSNPRKLIATYLEQQFKQLGITVKVDGKEFNTFTKQLSAKDFDISLSAVGSGFPDPNSFKERITTGGSGNYSQYSNPKVDDLFKKGQIEVDPAKRKALYDEAQVIVTEDAPVMFLWGYVEFTPVNKKVQGVVPSKHERLDWNDATTRWYLAAS